MEQEPAATSAVQFAARIPPGRRVRWDLLEGAAFHGSMTVFASVPPERVRAPTTMRGVLLWAVLAPLLTVAVAAPVVGVAAVGVKNRLDLPSPIATAGISFSIAIVAIVVATLVEVVRGRPAGRPLLTYSLVVAVSSLAAAYGMSFWGPLESPDDWLLWAIPVVVGGFVAFLVLVTATIHSARAETASLVPSAALPPATASVRRDQVARLPVPRRDAISADIREAIADLADRGVITPAVAWGARSAELGSLATIMLFGESSPSTSERWADELRGGFRAGGAGKETG